MSHYFNNGFRTPRADAEHLNPPGDGERRPRKTEWPHCGKIVWGLLCNCAECRRTRAVERQHGSKLLKEPR